MEKLFIEVDDLKVEVKVLSERVLFGREELEVTPATGSGSKWITKEKVIRLDSNLKAKIHG